MKKQRKVSDILTDISQQLNERARIALRENELSKRAWFSDIDTNIANGRYSIEISSNLSKTGKPILIDLYERSK